MTVIDRATVVRAIAERHHELDHRLAELDAAALTAPSLLPGWSRLTVLCHLRYGAQATRRLVRSAVVGQPAAFYPEGRDRQRPDTLEPTADEDSAAVVASLAAEHRALDEELDRLDDRQWAAVATEPPDKPDLGSVEVAMLALLRLTEVEVHGVDLDIGAGPWSSTFVDTALPVRLDWLRRRRPRPEEADTSTAGRWVFEADGGPRCLVAVDGPRVDVTALDPAADPMGDPATGLPRPVRLAGSRRALLGFLLGRVELEDLRVTGDPDAARRFSTAFPPP